MPNGARNILFAGIVCAGLFTACAADWPGLSRVQPRESVLSPRNVDRLEAIWTFTLDARPTTSPLVLGHWITNRGTKELLFVAAGREVYAIDGDLGRLFWKQAMPQDVDCIELEKSAVDNEEDEDDKPQALRRLFVHLKSGSTLALHPTHGGLLEAQPRPVCRPRNFRSVKASGVTYTVNGNVLHAFSPAKKYSSGSLVQARIIGGLAVANGHVSFATEDGTVYCFGFPIDQ